MRSRQPGPTGHSEGWGQAGWGRGWGRGGRAPRGAGTACPRPLPAPPPPARGPSGSGHQWSLRRCRPGQPPAEHQQHATVWARGHGTLTRARTGSQARAQPTDTPPGPLQERSCTPPTPAPHHMCWGRGRRPAWLAPHPRCRPGPEPAWWVPRLLQLEAAPRGAWHWGQLGLRRGWGHPRPRRGLRVAPTCWRPCGSQGPESIPS